VPCVVLFLQNFFQFPSFLLGNNNRGKYGNEEGA